MPFNSTLITAFDGVERTGTKFDSLRDVGGGHSKKRL